MTIYTYGGAYDSQQREVDYLTEKQRNVCIEHEIMPEKRYRYQFTLELDDTEEIIDGDLVGNRFVYDGAWFEIIKHAGGEITFQTVDPTSKTISINTTPVNPRKEFLLFDGVKTE